jgi:anti-anti-sigma factor
MSPPPATRSASACGESSTPAATIRLDLRELEFLDSTGLRVILSAQLRSAVDGDRLRITPGPVRVQRLFAMTGTADLLHFEDEADPPDNVLGMPRDE